jgi:hypothetical protein
MSNSEPSTIVTQGIPRMCGLYKFRFEKNMVRSRFRKQMGNVVGSPRGERRIRNDRLNVARAVPTATWIQYLEIRVGLSHSSDLEYWCSSM